MGDSAPAISTTCSGEAAQGVEVPQFAFFAVHGSFQEKCLAVEHGMAENSPEGRLADVALADVLVAVAAGSEGEFRIVGVDDGDAGEREDRFGAAEGFLESFGGGDVISGGEQVTGIEAVSEPEAGGSGRAVSEFGEFLEAAAQGAALPGRAFEQESEVFQREVFGGFRERGGEGIHGRADGLAAPATGMEDEVVGSDGGGALTFRAE